MTRLELRQKITSPHTQTEVVELILERESSDLDFYVDAFNAFLKSCGFFSEVQVGESE